MSFAPSIYSYAGDPVVAGSLEAPPNSEASGLTASRRSPGLLWLHDDSGGRPEIHAVNLKGVLQGKIRLDGASSGDWEDIAAAEIDGKAYLILADTGDNDAKRSKVYLHILPEPAVGELSPSGSVTVRPSASLRITYPDGPRDCEAVAVDAREGAIYLLSKRDETPRLYRVDIPRPLKSGDVTPSFVGEVGNLPQKGMKRSDGRVLSWPTAMDFSPDGRFAAVLTYTSPVLFERQGSEPWQDTLARTPTVLPPHDLPQAESLGFSSDGRSLYVASEKTRNLVRYDLSEYGIAAGWRPTVPLIVAGVASLTAVTLAVVYRKRIQTALSGQKE